MSYPAQLTNDAKLVLNLFLDRILALKEGESTLIKDNSPSTTQTSRYYLYAWLRINNMKSVYKIRMETPTSFRVHRKLIPSPQAVEVDKYSSVEKFVMDNLLDTEIWEEALPIVEKAMLDQEIDSADFDEIKSEFWRINGL